jgi:hypothetical protein
MISKHSYQDLFDSLPDGLRQACRGELDVSYLDGGRFYCWDGWDEEEDVV